MKFSLKVVLAILASCCVSHSHGYVEVPGTSHLGEGVCQSTDSTVGGLGSQSPDFAAKFDQTALSCDEICRANNDSGGLRGFTLNDVGSCYCHYDDGTSPKDYLGTCPASFDGCGNQSSGTGDLKVGDPSSAYDCYEYTTFPVPVPSKSESNGDPHFRTWKNEHFEFHGQCDLVMTKVKNFASKEGIDLEIHLRTNMVRYWSYIKTAAIRIGNDILEVEGSVDKEDGIDKRHYHINFDHLGPLTHLGGYPVTISPRNNKYTIDLDKDYPAQSIEIKTFKEFVGVKIIGATEESFGNAVGITGDFNTGNTYARDGSTVLHDFNELGLEWQVLPSDGKLFHEIAKPQFPELCYLPEDPRGDRARRLAESDITEEAAEAACAGLKNDFDRKGCVYDILATQDMDMVGAY
ncbi:unnamed protein product [Cylindrotheca closterium]|uniref:VWFD domain-containing protein n=1 Tax=Cylindrotheca closterium TaxID=2856 RepID=A0AAD2FVA9_9STRA|nr:unnamed protein product [Cylindrotheca closterium]